MAETFSIEFDGPAFDGPQIPAAALAQSLLALNDLAKQISRTNAMPEVQNQDPQVETVSRQERKYFRHEEGIVLTDNEVEVILDVLCCSLNGSPKGWRFSDGEEFSADFEDEAFLEAVKTRKVRLESGTSIRAVLRTVQYKASRTRSVKTVTEVREVIAPEE